MTSVATPTYSALVERILDEGPIGMCAIGRMLLTHPATPTRWATRGILLADGSRLRLEVVRIAGKLASSKAAVLRFLSAQQGMSSELPPIQTSAERRREDSAAETILDRAGIG